VTGYGKDHRRKRGIAVHGGDPDCRKAPEGEPGFSGNREGLGGEKGETEQEQIRKWRRSAELKKWGRKNSGGQLGAGETAKEKRANFTGGKTGMREAVLGGGRGGKRRETTKGRCQEERTYSC